MRLREMATLLTLTILIFPMHVQANLNQEPGGGRFYLSCVDDETCQLTPTPIGEEIISGQSTSTFIQNEVLNFEFDLSPKQSHIALLPQELDELSIDFIQQTESLGVFRPKAEIRLITGQNVNSWIFESNTFSSPSAYEPYRLENEPMTYDFSRVVWPEDQVKLFVSIVLDQPGTWELRLRGNSFINLDINWSIDPNFADVDEPSSQLQPVETEFEMLHFGALLGDDKDCWRFEVQTNEIMRLYIDWLEAPLEVEQPHSVPLVFDSIGKELPYPEIVSEFEEGNLRIIYRWRAVPIDSYTVCLSGQDARFQQYQWGGSFGFESLGPVNPDGFQPFSYFPAGSSFLGNADSTVSLDKQGMSGLIFFGILFLFSLLLFTQPTTNLTLRYMIFLPGVLFLLVGGVILPTISVSQQSQDDSMISFDELFDMRLSQLWDVAAPGIPEQNLYRHSGATFGLLHSDSFTLRLNVQRAYEVDDGRWQLQIEELQSFRIDEAIFTQISKGGAQLSDSGMLEDHTVRFILLSGRSLLLDLLMLESMLIVDEKPTSSVFDLQLDMISTTPAGSVNAPAWATRPTSVSESDWSKLQSSLFPDRLTISLCDCELDLVDVRFEPSNRFDASDVPTAEYVVNYANVAFEIWLFAWVGVVLCAYAGSIEIKRIIVARKLAIQASVQSKMWN
ncbi:MAG: hypothetical protein VW230_01690 [Candidatus Poseidoniales archaeon]